MGRGAVRVERDGPVTTVLLHRPQRRNAVDGPTAAALVAAFRAFDADESRAVAVLHGEGGVFCAGADLTALGNRARQPGRPGR
jgi:enoyl-CoA hydratase